MKRLVVLSLAAMLLFSGCSKGNEATGQTDEPAAKPETLAVFPMTDVFIGDTMPFFDNGKMNIFYLADQRNGTTGYHPWALVQTEDYCHYEDKGIVIPYGETIQDQDIALGTGCVIKDDKGTYHAFYTGHNDVQHPKEAVMHATSTDMENWTKIPGDTFTAPEGKYSQDDFRDPYVRYMEQDQCYWMLVVTREAGSGVIVKYTSKDLSTWTDEGVFFEDDMGYGTNMECPTIIEYNGTWYLSFSDQWPDRLVHYRTAKSPDGPFEKPEDEVFDGDGFYAGRMETDGENLYCVGWNATKVSHDNKNDYDWAGNMVVHQLKQNADGTLEPVVNEKVVANMPQEMKVSPIVMTNTIKADGNNYAFAGDKYELVKFPKISDSFRMEADITGLDGEDKIGIGCIPNKENVGTLNLVLNVKENQIEFYNTDKLTEEEPQSKTAFDFAGKDSIHITLINCDGVVCLYVDDEAAMTARMYASQVTEWELFGINSAVEWKNVSLFTAKYEEAK